MTEDNIPTVEESETKYEFVAEDGTLTSIPKTGKVNVIELRQEDRTDYLFTRLPKELVLKYSSGEVKTRYSPTKGTQCMIAVKYRGSAIDANMPETIGDCYTLIFCPHFAEVNADLEHIAEGISDVDMRHALLALDESKALVFRNKWLVEKELRESADDLEDKKVWRRREAATQMAATMMDDQALGQDAVQRDIDLWDTNKASKWIQKNIAWVVFIIIGIAIIASMFIQR